MAVTLQDISKLAGVDVGSVSRVLRDHPRAKALRPETRARVLEAARAAGYRRNELAATMRTGVNRTVGVVARFGKAKTVELNSSVIAGILAEASRLNYGVKIYSDDDLTASVNEILGNKIKYVLSLSATRPEREEIASLCQANNLRLAYVYERPCGGFPAVAADNQDAAREATLHLARAGHKRIALVCAPHGFAYTRERHLGYLRGLRQAGLRRDKRLITCEEHPAEAIKTMLRLPEGQRPTAFFCIGDAYAMLAQRFALDLGLKVPADVSVVGFGNSDLGEAAYSPLSTIAEPYEALGQTALRILLGQPCDIAAASENRYLLPAPLVDRKSVAPPRTAKL